MLNFLYRTALGRILLKPMKSRALSKLAGVFMDSRISTALIPRFVRKNVIDLSDYEVEKWRSFNEFFYRRIRPEKRPPNTDPRALASPCDGLLSAYRVKDGLVIPVKQSEYSLARLLGDEQLAARYQGGLCLVFRLCVHHYHRYAYVETGRKSADVFIRGKLHTVQPIALELSPVFTENCRVYTTIDTTSLGKVVQMEVGAMMVGRIENLEPGEADVRRGEEKGRFMFGGSTVIVLLEEGKATLRDGLLEATQKGEEVPVILGETLGEITG